MLKSGAPARQPHAVVLAALLLLAGTLIGAPARGADGSRFRPGDLVTTDRGAVASVHPIASKIGIDVLDGGGNAIDAAVAMAFALGVVRPDLTSLGGGGFMVYRSADGREVRALDFREAAPYDVTPGFRDGPGPDDFSYPPPFGPGGHRTVGVPGMVAGLGEALRVYGTRSLEDVVARSVPIARDGFIVSPELATLLFLGAPYLRLFPETSRIFLPHSARGFPQPSPTDAVVFALFDTPEGTPAQGPAREALWLQQPDLANTLEVIAEQGVDGFYEGGIATKLVREFETSGVYPGNAARLTHDDLEDYEAIWREPIRSTYRGNQIIGAPAPASGGIVLAETLNILEGFPLAGWEPSSANHLHSVTEALKVALADRKEYMGDPEVVDVPDELLTSKAYAAERRAEIELEKTKIYAPAGGPATERPECTPPGARHTTHVSVIDESGNAVSMTLSIGGPFGSGVVAKDTGILLNNHLLDFDTVDVLCQPSNGQTGAKNAPGPGLRPVSAMSPTLVVRGNRAILAIGGAGGPTILRGVPQAVINFLDHGMDVAHAIDAERVFPANVAAPPDDDEEFKAVDVLDMEGKRIAAEVREQLRTRGHRIATNQENVEYAGVPDLEGVGRLRSGWLMPYSDPRSENGAMVQQPSG